MHLASLAFCTFCCAKNDLKCIIVICGSVFLNWTLWTRLSDCKEYPRNVCWSLVVVNSLLQSQDVLDLLHCTLRFSFPFYSGILLLHVQSLFVGEEQPSVVYFELSSCGLCVCVEENFLSTIVCHYMPKYRSTWPSLSLYSEFSQRNVYYRGVMIYLSLQYHRDMIQPLKITWHSAPIFQCRV